jgi:hypothetical protein
MPPAGDSAFAHFDFKGNPPLKKEKLLAWFNRLVETFPDQARHPTTNKEWEFEGFKSHVRRNIKAQQPKSRKRPPPTTTQTTTPSSSTKKTKVISLNNNKYTPSTSDEDNEDNNSNNDEPTPTTTTQTNLLKTSSSLYDECDDDSDDSEFEEDAATLPIDPGTTSNFLNEELQQITARLDEICDNIKEQHSSHKDGAEQQGSILTQVSKILDLALKDKNEHRGWRKRRAQVEAQLASALQEIGRLKDDNASKEARNVKIASERQQLQIGLREYQRKLATCRKELDDYQKKLVDKESRLSSCKISLINCQKELAETQQRYNLLHTRTMPDPKNFSFDETFRIFGETLKYTNKS